MDYHLPSDVSYYLQPDFSLIPRDKPLLDHGAAPYMPDLAVDIQDTHQTVNMMMYKAIYYLVNGSRLVWMIFPDRHSVGVWTHVKRYMLSSDSMLEGEDVLAGFSVAVSALFPMM